MANTCTNELHLSCDPEDVNIIKNFMIEIFRADIYEEYKDEDSIYIEMIFDSKWNFPEKELNKLLTKLIHVDRFSGACLSVEWGNYYCAFHTCNGESYWILES